jgi:peroxiredoxin
MKRNGFILYLVLAVLLSGCRQRETPQPELEVPATYDEAAAPQEEALPQPPTETALPEEPTVSEPEVTVTENTVPTEITVLTEPVSTLPLPIPTVTAPPQGENITLCGHDYQPGFYQAPTCEQAGYQNYRCQKCGDVQQQLSLPLGHSYTDATCIAPKICNRCGMTEGSSLGHHYTNGLCSRCGDKDPKVRTITIQVKDSKNAPVDGVTVELYIADALHSTAVSTGGRVTFTLKNHTGSYTLVLTQIPAGYKAQKDRYTYRSDSGAIVLDIVPVVYPDDHSKAAYKVGSTMGDFTVTDVDGKTYQLSRLLREKKLVILNFWYYTCAPCKAEFPYFNSIYQRYGDDIEILALNHFDSENQIRQLRSEMGLTFPLATEHLGMQQGFDIKSYPVSVFIGSDGRILHIQKNVGFQSEVELDTIIRQMLGT